jgi:hypothetical protein
MRLFVDVQNLDARLKTCRRPVLDTGLGFFLITLEKKESLSPGQRPAGSRADEGWGGSR